MDDQDAAPSVSEPTGTPEPNRPAREARREQAAADVLRAYVRDLVLAACSTDELPSEPFGVSLMFEVDPGDAFALTFSPGSLRDQVMAQVEDRTARLGAFVPGHIYCYRCHSSQCEHSRPASPGLVFEGYGTTGVPQWKEFGQVLLDLREERVHQLYARPPAVVARVMTGKALKTDQLHSFGRASKTYSLLGQVVAGYFLLPDEDGSKAERVAMTFQFVETRRRRGVPALHVNLLAALPDGADLAGLFADGWVPWVDRAYRVAARAITRMQQQLAERDGSSSQSAGAILGRIPRIMAQLAASLDRGYRQSERRTPHAEQRRRQRPVQSAVEDTNVAAPDQILHDIRTGRIVIQGRHGRFHVFTPDAKHLTTFRGGPDTVDFRIRTERWRPTTEEERAAWSEAWSRALASDRP